MRLLFAVYITLAAIWPIPLGAFWTGFDVVKSGTSVVKISSVSNNGPSGLTAYSKFGSSVANIGDLDGDGVDDLVVGAKGEGLQGSPSQGAIYILFMTISGAVKNHTRIGHLSNGGPLLVTSDEFGAAVSSAGDVNNDGIMDIAVGAPGYILGTVYLLFMKKDGTASSYRIIRGKFRSKIDLLNTSLSNGPPQSYGSRFGNSLTYIGDFNKDGMPDLAVGMLDSSNGDGRVYMLFLDRSATVLNYTSIGANVGGGPNIAFFSGFASSIVTLADKDNDGNIEIAIGANSMGDTPESKPKSGAVFICFLNSLGTAKRCTIMGQLSAKKHTIPLQADDSCGSALASIGDINMDQMRQQRFPELKVPSRISVEDLVTGCPQKTSGSPGKVFLFFVDTLGELGGFTLLPNTGNSQIYLTPRLNSLGLFGASLAGYQDLDNSGIREIVVGSPGDDDGGVSVGAIYVLFLGRESFIGKYRLPLNTILIAMGVFVFAVLVIIFCWIFRRKKNIVEVSAMVVGHEIEGVDEKGEIKKIKKIKRVHKIEGGTILTYADNYDM